MTLDLLRQHDSWIHLRGEPQALKKGEGGLQEQEAGRQPIALLFYVWWKSGTKDHSQKNTKSQRGTGRKMSLTLDRASQEASSSPADNGGTPGVLTLCDPPWKPLRVHQCKKDRAEINLELTQGGRRNKRKARKGYWGTRGYCLPESHF